MGRIIVPWLTIEATRVDAFRSICRPKHNNDFLLLLFSVVYFRKDGGNGGA
jgi:hypothetical protein